MTKTIRAGLVTGLLLPAACTPLPLPVGASYPTTVDCGAGQSVNAAIAAGYNQITVKGTCDEAVVIAADGITLLADPAGATIAPTSGEPAVSMNGAARTVIDGIVLDGSGAVNHAVYMRHSDVILQGVRITGGKAAGLYVSTDSSANVQNSQLVGNDTAMTVINHSFANVTGGTQITQTRFVALISSRASSVNFGGGSSINGVENGVGIAVAASAHVLMREESTVTNVNGRGIEAEGSSVEVTESTITGVSGDAIRSTAAASVMLDRAMVTGNGGRGVVLDGSSGGEYRLSTITGNAGGPLSVSPDSEFLDRGGNTVGP